MANLNQFCDFTKLIGNDIAKRVFQIYSCDTQTGEITNVQVKRGQGGVSRILCLGSFSRAAKLTALLFKDSVCHDCVGGVR